MDSLLTMEAVHDAVVVYHQWWMGALFWTSVGVGLLAVIGLAVGIFLFYLWSLHADSDIGPSELILPGAMLIPLDVVLWAVYGALRLFGFQ